MSKVLTAIYFFILGVEIIADSSGDTQLMYLTKPLLMPVLMFGYLRSVPRGGLKKFDYFILLALLFSLSGDVFLMFRQEKFFVFGLGSFLLGHVFYILLFTKNNRFNFLRALPFLIYSVTFFLILFNKLPEGLLIPVGLYSLVIALMGIWAANRKAEVRSYYLVLSGAVSFIVSDSLIAYGKFIRELPYSSFWIMTTYGLAQYLIVEGTIAGKEGRYKYNASL
ncbi:lysoplasmalogenase [Emticicia sp. CRIBPO]|uniref:lysoplasmalogenase n=1 Tax=Emticicia sp. CRIBPO TaxID=2683258 RepID=UPI0014135080|nr:lysoplasmalogenase [Emticicia sp. CRIBPO]NBA88558.1 lysoplasmalogenase [Emticicia sp. CRIBPO]